MLRVGNGFDADWVAAVRSVCDPVFEAAEVGFLAQVMMNNEVADTLLWEADPQRFAQHYPDSGIVDSYGSTWPPPCIDYWIYVDPRQSRARLRPEGWSVPEIQINLSGDGTHDGLAIAREFARILRLTEPTV